MKEYEQSDIERLVFAPSPKSESSVEIICPRKGTSLSSVFINLGPASFSYREGVLLVARNDDTKETKILFEEEGILKCATYQNDKTRIRYMYKAKKP